MAWLVFFLYLVFFSWIITRIGFIKRSGLPSKFLIGVFFIKIVAGIGYFLFLSQPQYKYRSDTWKFYENSLAETDVLKSDPLRFFREIFTSGYNGTGGLFSDNNSYWNDVKDTVMIKLVAITNLFTFNNYYADIILFNFIFFVGLIAFYRVMKDIFPGKNYPLAGAVFFIPSFLFWCSGIHKDGLIFSCIGLIIYGFHSLLNKRSQLFNTILITLCLGIVFILRNYLVLAMIPSLIPGWLWYRYPRKKWILALFFFSGMVLFFSAKYIHPALDFPAYVVDKLHQFKKLDGNSLVDAADLEPTFGSFMRNLPAAIDMGFFRPHPGEKGLMSLIASAEIILFWLIIIACIVYSRKKFLVPPVILTCFIFSILILLIIGYTVPFSGAVVRYRSLVLPLILAPMAGITTFTSNIIKKYM